MANVAARIRPGAASLPELILLNRCERAKLPTPELQVRAVETRQWRWDLGWRLGGGRWLLVEVQGGTWSAGRHGRGAGYAKDAEKRNTAQLLGHLCLDVTPEQVESGQAVEWIRAALGGRGDPPKEGSD